MRLSPSTSSLCAVSRCTTCAWRGQDQGGGPREGGGGGGISLGRSPGGAQGGEEKTREGKEHFLDRRLGRVPLLRQLCLVLLLVACELLVILLLQALHPCREALRPEGDFGHEDILLRLSRLPHGEDLLPVVPLQLQRPLQSLFQVLVAPLLESDLVPRVLGLQMPHLGGQDVFFLGQLGHPLEPLVLGRGFQGGQVPGVRGLQIQLGLGLGLGSSRVCVASRFN
jgi:hypothetical protein